MKVKITKGDAWYTNEVGNTFEVKEETSWFRTRNGGDRVKHYIVHEENPAMVGLLIRERLIECDHAEVV
jgi:hypothetical protein